MNRTIVGLLIAASVVSVAPVAQAKGCLKGAAVGGVGGHVAGHHGLAGAAVGCAVGRHMANKKDKATAAAQNAPAPATTAQNRPVVARARTPALDPLRP